MYSIQDSRCPRQVLIRAYSCKAELESVMPNSLNHIEDTSDPISKDARVETRKGVRNQAAWKRTERSRRPN
jgi:hypothetical protein